MKHIWLYLMLWCAAFMSMSCLSVSEQPQFTAIAGNDLEPIKLLHRALEEHNTVQLYFSGTATLSLAEAVLVRTNQEAACTVEPLAVSDAVLDELNEADDNISAFTITPSIPIEIGEKANITLFTDQGEWVMNKKDIISSSKNCAFVGENCKGKVQGVITERGQWLV